MKVNKNGKINVVLIFVILIFSLIPSMAPVSARYNWVEWEGRVYNDWGNNQTGVTVRLKYGSTTLDSDITDEFGYYFIRAYIDNSKRYTLKASKANWTSQQYDNLIGRPEGSGPWWYEFNLQYVETWAVIVGIEDYELLSDAKYSNNDADQWNDQLTDESGLDFDHVTVLKDGAAIEKSIKSSLTTMVTGADGGDIIAFIFSGHGHYNSSISSYALAAHDATSGDDGEDGDLYDTELASIMENSIAERVFFFFDCCFAIGMKDELDDLDNANTFFLAAASDSYQSSFYDEIADLRCWTQCFLHYSWNGDSPGFEGSITADFFNVWGIAFNGYTYYDYMEVVQYDNAEQTPQLWNPYGSGFCLSKYGISPQ